MIPQPEARLTRLGPAGASVASSAPRPAPSRSSSSSKVKFTGLTQNSQVDPEFLLKTPIRALELTQILGQPCEFQVLDIGETVILLTLSLHRY